MDDLDYVVNFLHTGNFISYINSQTNNQVKNINKLSDYLLYLINLNQTEELSDYKILDIIKTSNLIVPGISFILNCVEKYKLIKIYTLYSSIPFVPRNIYSIKSIVINDILFDFEDIILSYLKYSNVDHYSNIIHFNTRDKSSTWQPVGPNTYVVTEDLYSYIPIIRRVQHVPNNTLCITSDTRLDYLFKLGSYFTFNNQKYFYHIFEQACAKYSLYTSNNIRFILSYTKYKDVCNNKNIMRNYSFYLSVTNQSNDFNIKEFYFSSIKFEYFDDIKLTILDNDDTYIQSHFYNKRYYIYNNFFSIYYILPNIVRNNSFFKYMNCNKLIPSVEIYDKINNNIIEKLICNLYGKINIDFKRLKNDGITINSINLFAYNQSIDRMLFYKEDINVLDFDHGTINSSTVSDYFKIIFKGNEIYKNIYDYKIYLYDFIDYF